jgi:hypothetical protein
MCPGKGKVVNHKDGNGLNNCRCNLEVVTHKENSAARNKHHHHPNNTGCWGISKTDNGYRLSVDNFKITATTLQEALNWRDGLLDKTITRGQLRVITKSRQPRKGKMNNNNKPKFVLACKDLARGLTISAVARKYDVKRDTIYRWRERSLSCCE